MEAYTDFAVVYDTFMDTTPYREWADYLVDFLAANGFEPAKQGGEDDAEETPREQELWKNLRSEKNTILDLGCGTGSLTELLSREGYEMIGVDNSEEMLAVAIDKRDKLGLDILYLNQDMRELELYGTVGAVVSVCDSLNYLLEEADLLQTFSLVNNYLYPGGLFVFDFNTRYKYETVIGDTVIAENREDCSFIWENYFDVETQINEYDLTLFVKKSALDRTGEDGLFCRFQEVHCQRGYTPEQMVRLVKEAGMEVISVTDADTLGEVCDVSERVYVAAREKGKEKQHE